jgi:hypothetical protein
MDIVLDFDGTVVLHSFPEIGEDIGAVSVLKKLVENNHRLILFTMRSEKFLDDAVKWFSDNSISLYGIQTNPTQHNWTKSPKAYGQLIIDDAALGAPLKFDIEIHPRPFIDWDRADKMFEEMGLYNKSQV